MKYSWHQPKFRAGDLVHFIDNWNVSRQGTVSGVETRYCGFKASHQDRIVIHDLSAKRVGYYASENRMQLISRPIERRGNEGRALRTGKKGLT